MIAVKNEAQQVEDTVEIVLWEQKYKKMTAYSLSLPKKNASLSYPLREPR